MGYRFSLILNRVVTKQEAVALKESSAADLSFAADALPTDAGIAVTRLEFTDEITPTLAEAIELGFAAVKAIPELSIPGLSVPAQPATPEQARAAEDAKETVEAAS
ncbi:hypothetical protein [Streptomyces qinzhouensis]|uniref:Uncharacterized protein n=1 Tax=Streptomyces qinzhouensis TaxID=2599401 RepID=A0A5B8JEN0_9ACTN|nr:hypothetical protein [Streptomyces qinzhouensis]QDY80225.1 hypothetical protein FQU76_31115 [Streptomyces qinzhouensis]